jgi:hypothetical protein
MQMPSLTAASSLYQTTQQYREGRSASPASGSGQVVPQLCKTFGCYRVPAGTKCLSFKGVRVCVTIPRTGRWKIRCCAQIGFPGGISVSCAPYAC